MPIVHAQGLTVRYGAREALSSLDLAIESGVTGLLGPNGAGKSTFLKTLLGFLNPSAGTVNVLGRPASRTSSELRSALGYFPERAVYIPGLNAVESVALAGEIGGLARADALARAHEMLWFTGLGEARYRPVEEFSTGMRQRAKLAMALVHDPDLLLLDEPTSGLDPAGRRQMLDLVREIGRRGISVLLSTHLLHDVEEVCERVVLLHHGRVVLGGKLAELSRAAGWVYEIRVREEEPGGFRRELASRGIETAEERDGLLRVSLAEPSTRLLFESAANAPAEIRHLRRFEKSLEDRFLAAVGDG
ncbi:MAG TPA: ABC transporter ATP-binding protein [Vicinamibacteria bacterium]|nr:ABC transporter ATP-binding protein [Vicinamibacteria bacterium]